MKTEEKQVVGEVKEQEVAGGTEETTEATETKKVPHKNIHVAFLAAQRNMSNAKKGSENPHFKFNYADLNSVREAVCPALLEEGIYISQSVVMQNERNYIRTVLFHAESETSISTDIEILVKAQNDAQAQGSAITYARRYGLQTLCGIGAQDDDGNGACKEPKSAPKAKQQAAQPQQQAPAPQQPDDNLLIAIDEVQRASTIEELVEVWGRWKSYQGHPQFKAETTKHKEQLNTKQTA